MLKEKKPTCDSKMTDLVGVIFYVKRHFASYVFFSMHREKKNRNQNGRMRKQTLQQ